MTKNLPSAEVIANLVKDNFTFLEIAQMFRISPLEVKEILLG